MNIVRKINDWMDWRGISWKDLFYAGFALGTLLAMIGLLIGASL
jgi:hypothetical protein